MATVSTYLNFPGNTEEAFLFYKSVFGGEFRGGITRFSDTPTMEGMPPFPVDARDMVMHIELPILGDHVLTGTDAPESCGFTVIQGNNIYISLEPDSRSDTKTLFDALSEGGQITAELQDMFWGSYYGTCTDRFGLHWMFNFRGKS